ncbi:MAG: apolipoprotein N-acyltransferase, partial [Planctomycetota bacterium]
MHKKYFITTLPFSSAFLIWLSYPPVDISLFAWISYIPLFSYLFVKSKEDGFFIRRFPFASFAGFKFILTIYLAGLLFFILGLNWLRYVSGVGLFVVPSILSFYWVIFAISCYFIIRFVSLFYAALCISCLWVFLEYVRSFLLTGFPWFFAGHSQYQWLSLIQITDTVGVYGLSFIVILVNAVLFIMIKQRFYLSMKNIILVGITLLLFIISILYGNWRLDNLITTNGPAIGIIQGNIEQSLKNNPDNAEDIYNKHLYLTLNLLESQTRPDLIIWAESMFPYLVLLDDDEVVATLTSTALLCRTPMLIGILTCIESDAYQYRFVTREEERIYPIKIFNSACYLDSKGKIINRYDKTHLVPMSEYVPFRETFPIIDDIILAFSELPYIASISPGTNLEPFTLSAKKDNLQIKDYKYGVLICYESVFPELARESIRRGSDFIINISNDGWFKNSAELDQMLAISAFRSVENRISFIRATNTGISAIIHPSGKINILRNNQGQSKEVEGVWVEYVPVLQKTGAFYTRYGDYFPYFCFLIFSIIIIFKYIKII